MFFGEPEGNNHRRQSSERGAQGCSAFLAGPPSILRRRPSRLRACSRSSGGYRNWTNLCIVRFERWCFRAPNWMTASGHEETRRPRDPRDRSSSVTGPRCGGQSGAPVKAPRRGGRTTADQAQQPCRQAHGRAKALADLKIEKAAVEGRAQEGRSRPWVGEVPRHAARCFC